MDHIAEPLDVIDAIFTTGAQRRLKADPVPDWLIWAVVDAAIRGPSGGNRQRWAWIVVTDDSVKRLIGSWYLDAWNALGMGRRARLHRLVQHVTGHTSAPAVDAAPHDANYRSGEYLANNIARAPVWIFAVVTGIKGTPSVADGADIFGAVQNLMLAARRYGLGSTLTMLHRKQEDRVASVLGLPRDARPLALIPIGFPASGRFFTNRRQPVETVTHWGAWNHRRARPVAPTATRADHQAQTG